MDGAPVIACNLHAIGAADRPRYHELVKKLKAAIGDRRELPNGYVFTVESGAIRSEEISEWISMERLCCPFLEFQVAGCFLQITGPAGAKAILDSEFPIWKRAK